MSLANVKYVYFLGIGGIGMSSIARWFLNNKYKVYGYDRTETELTRELNRIGIKIKYNDKIETIPEDIYRNIDQCLIVYTPALPKDHPQYLFFKEKKFKILKRAKILGLITEQYFTIAIAGTHGKTTTSALISHILVKANKNVLAFLGGITQNYNTNLIINKEKKDVLCVVEADEFDKSFLTLYPNIAVLNSVDADHLDIFKDAAEVIHTYESFVDQIKYKGVLIIKEEIRIKVRDDLEVNTFSLLLGNIKCSNLRIENSKMVYDIISPLGIIKDIKLSVPGYHNIENSLAATAVAINLKVSLEDIKEGIESFKGVKRRFEYYLESKELTIIDDYAHHPEEVKAFLKSVRDLYPQKIITAIFQPHLYSRTRDFFLEFAESLSLADKIVVLPIYPAREEPIEGITSELILDNIEKSSKYLCTKDNLIATIASIKSDVIVTMGAGDINNSIAAIINIFR